MRRKETRPEAWRKSELNLPLDQRRVIAPRISRAPARAPDVVVAVGGGCTVASAVAAAAAPGAAAAWVSAGPPVSAHTPPRAAAVLVSLAQHAPRLMPALSTGCAPLQLAPGFVMVGCAAGAGAVAIAAPFGLPRDYGQRPVVEPPKPPVLAVDQAR